MAGHIILLCHNTGILSFIGKTVPLMAILAQFEAFIIQVWGAGVVPNVTALYCASDYPVPSGGEGQLSSSSHARSATVR